MQPTSPANGTPHDHTPTTPPPPGPDTKPPTAGGGRDSHGRFAEGNRGGPGNPFARQVAALRCALLSALTPQDIADVGQELLRQAKEGSLAAARLLLSYTLGKPAAAVDPDTLDAQEWENYRRVPDPAGDLMVMTRRMPLEAGLTVARALLPGLADVWAGEIGDGLRRQERLERQQAERAARRPARKAEKASAKAALPAEAKPAPQGAPGAPPADEEALALLGRLSHLTPPSPNGPVAWLGEPRPPSTNGRGNRGPGPNGKAP